MEERTITESDGEVSGVSAFYISNAKLEAIEGGHFRVRFRVLNKATNLPPKLYESQFALEFDGWNYCKTGEPRTDGWLEGTYTPSKPGPTWVKISTQITCPITDPDHIRLVYP